METLPSQGKMNAQRLKEGRIRELLAAFKEFSKAGDPVTGMRDLLFMAIHAKGSAKAAGMVAEGASEGRARLQRLETEKALFAELYKDVVAQGKKIKQEILQAKG